MPINRFFSDAHFIFGKEAYLADQELHHLSHVVRTKEGETVELVNGKGQLAQAVVSRIDKKKAVLELQKITEAPTPIFNPVIVLAIPRINRLDMIVEKGTELGMGELWLFPGVHSEKREISENQLNRLITISIGAMKQCGRLFLPPITVFPPLSKWNNFPKNCYFGDLSPSVPIFYQEWQRKGLEKEIYFFIGPESGFHKDELKILKDNHAIGTSLHGNILRTDTAAISALAVITHLELGCRHLPST
jgi:16S rRNA (uracil1498-N3)-methyltransferase